MNFYLRRLAIFLIAAFLMACAGKSASKVEQGSQVRDEGLGASTVLNQKLMYEQNAVTPAELLRNVPGVTR